MTKLSLTTLGVACAALLAFSGTASAGILNLTDGPNFTPPESFTNNTIEADTVINGGLIHLVGNATITPGSGNTASIDLSGTFSADAGDKFSLAYSFVVDSGIATPFTYAIVASASIGGTVIPIEATGTIMPGLHKYEGTFASPPLATSAGDFSGTITFNFSSMAGVLAAAAGSIDLAIQQIDFKLSPNEATVAAPAEQQNLSTRGNVGVADDVLIGGFIITGNDDKQVVLRAIGPSLDPTNVANPLADPVLELHDSTGAPVATNDNWMDNSADDQTTLTDNNLAPTDDNESALVRTLSPGRYTVTVRGANQSSGVALVEIYDLDNGTTDSKLANISTRGTVGTDENALIGGFIVGGGGGGFSTTIVRGLGPSLNDASISDFLADPILELRDADGNLIDSNDNWMDNPNRQSITDDGLAPTDDNESALYEILSPGLYTAILFGTNGSTGVGLVEVYDVVE